MSATVGLGHVSGLGGDLAQSFGPGPGREKKGEGRKPTSDWECASRRFFSSFFLGGMCCLELGRKSKVATCFGEDHDLIWLFNPVLICRLVVALAIIAVYIYSRCIQLFVLNIFTCIF